MATLTFNTPTRLIEAPINTLDLDSNSQLTIKIKDNITNTYIGSKTIPADSLRGINGQLEVESDNSNPYTLAFYKNSLGEVFPKSVTYTIYEKIKIGDNPEQRDIVARFSVNSELQDNDFKYYISLLRLNKDRVSLDFGGKQPGTRYNEGNTIQFNVTSLNFNIELARSISISYTDQFSGKLFNKSFVKSAIKNSIEDNLAIGSGSGNSFNLVNQRITESERFLKFGVITGQGDNLLVTNWVDGGTLNQIDDEIEPLGSLVLELYNSAAPLTRKDTVIFTELYANDIILDVDLSEDAEGLLLRRLTPNFQKEVEENTISTFNEYQNFNDLTLSGSSVQERVIDYFLQRKQDAVGLNTDFTDFNEFVKFSSAEERLVNFRYKVTQLEDLREQSASLATSSANTTFIKNQIEDINDEIRTIKNGFDEHEQFMFNDSGSLYENKPFVSSSDNVYASWPKNTPQNLLTGSFSSASVESGEISQSLSLAQDTEHVLQFDVVANGLPLSFEYNGKVIVSDQKFSSGSNEFTFRTNNLSNNNDILTIKGSELGDQTSIFTEIDNVVVKETPQLLASNSSFVTDWFNNFRDIARDYDARNKDSLRNNTPEYIRNDSQNDDYILFLDMIGQVFDEIWLYGKELGNLYEWDNSIEQGLSEDLSIVLLEAYGNNLDIGFSEKDVWEYILGIDKNESEIGRQLGFSFERRQKETIRRLLVNLPYFLKHKGTSRSIKGLVLSYGIPLSTMFIREYGTFQGTQGLETIFTKETETKKLFMSGSKSISLTDSELNTSNAIEFNFQLLAPTGSDITLVSGSSPDGFDISISGSGANGSIVVNIDGNKIVSSQPGPLYDGEFWNVLAQQTDSGSYEVRAYQFNREDGTFNYKLSGSAVSNLSASIDPTWETGTSIEFRPFNGYLDEWRVWDAEISENVFIEHVKFPTSIKLDDPLQIPDKLLIRVDVETENSKYIAELDGQLPNLVFNPQYATRVTASGFTISDFETFTRTDYIKTTNVGNEKLGNNKVRYQVTQSLPGDVLTPNVSFDSKERNNEIITDIEDSYKLTIGFSPTDITNEIILQHFGGNDLLDEFGDPQNQYDARYPELEKTVENFFENISSNNKAKFFIEYIRNFDKTLFENIKKFVPERADLATSIFIEPHFLNRSKAKRLGKSETEDLFKKGNEVQDAYEVSSTSNTEKNDDNENKEGLVTTDEETLVGEILSDANPGEVIAVISDNEVLDYLNQSTDVIILNDGFESQVLQNNVWNEDSTISVTNRYGEKFVFKVYKFDYKTELAELEAEIGNYLSTNTDIQYSDGNGNIKYEEDETYRDLTREWEKFYELDGKLFLLKFDTNPIDNAVLVTYEDLPHWLKEDLIFSIGTTSTDKTVSKNGITYEISDDTADGGSVVEVTKVSETRTIVSEPDADIKLTVE